MNPLFTIEGIVQKGDGRGAELGFPTANIPCPEFVPHGIFAGEVVRNKETYPAALYRDPKKNILEAYLLDFSEDLYGEKIKIIGYQKIRGVKRFNSDEELMNTIAQDIKVIQEWFILKEKSQPQ